jgi:acyl-CoA thioesterase-2
MSKALADLLELLELEVLEVNLFRGLSPDEAQQRVFGGQVAAQALVAAGRTVEPDRSVHSLHSYFLRPGDPTVPIVYEVDRIRDGRSFTTRRVVAIQHGRAIFNLAASFQILETGPDHAAPMPSVPDPEQVPTFRERVEPHLDRFGPDAAHWLTRERPIDSRHVEEPKWLHPGAREPTQDVWIRANGALPDDPLVHACVVAFASDLSLLDTATLPHAIGQDGNYQMASLDHAMWFHRPFRADDWLLYHQMSPSASGARGLALGHVFTRDGALAVTVIQEGLIRPVGRGGTAAAGGGEPGCDRAGRPALRHGHPPHGGHARRDGRRRGR